MSTVYVVTNQHGLFINRQKEWVDGRDTKILFRSPHKDEAINLVFELSAKDIYLRAEAIGVELDDKGQPVVEVTAEVPPPDQYTLDNLESADADGDQPLKSEDDGAQKCADEVESFTDTPI